MTAGQRHARREAPGPMMDARRNTIPARISDGWRASRVAKGASGSRREAFNTSKAPKARKFSTAGRRHIP